MNRRRHFIAALAAVVTAPALLAAEPAEITVYLEPT
jgi:hypothetical protein